MLYDRPVYELMADAVAAMPDRFAPADVIEWFAVQYPLVKDTTVRAHVIGLTANDPTKRHYRWLANKSPLFYKLGHGALTRFDPDQHADVTAVESTLDEETEAIEALGDDDRMEFFLEAYLEEFLVTNWHLIDWGRHLRVWGGDAGQSGHQLATPVGRLDFLCIDEDTNALVVVELKRGLPSDRVVGQAARYMGWARSELAAPMQEVEGLIVVQEVDDKLRYAVAAVPGLGLLRYEVAFSLQHIDAPRGA